MFADPIKQMVEVDKTRGMIAILFEKAASGFTLAKANFSKRSIQVISNNYQRSGIKVQKVVPLDYEEYVLIYGER